MCPRTIFQLMRDCIYAKQFQEAWDHADALHHWMSNGGFRPEEMDQMQFYDTYWTLRHMSKNPS